MSATRITCIAIAILAGIVSAGCSSVEVRKERQRIKVIDATRSPDEVFANITKILDRRIDKK